MRNADATITFDTRMDPKGFETGIGNIDKSMDGVRGTLSRVASATEAAFGKTAQQRVSSFTTQLKRELATLDRQRATVENLRKQLELLTSGDVRIRSLETMQVELVRTETEMRNLEKRIESLQSRIEQRKEFGADTTDLERQLHFVQNALQFSEERASTLVERMDAIRLDPSTSDEAKKLAEELGQAASQLEQMATEATTTERNLKKALSEQVPAGWAKSASKARGVLARLTGGMKDLQKETHRTNKMLDRFFQRFWRMVQMALIFATIRRGIQNLMSYIGGLARQNDELVASLERLRVNLAVAFQPIWTAALPALEALMDSLARASQYVAQFIARLFGTTYDAALESAQAMNQQADATDNVTKATKEAAGQLASFDKINKQAAATAMTISDQGPKSLADLLAEAIPPDYEPEWIKKLIGWFEKLRKEAQPTIDALKRLWNEGLKPLGNFIWTGLKDFYNHFLVPVGRWVLGIGLPRLVDAIRDGLARVDWATLNTALRTLWDRLAAFAIRIGEGLIWFFENAIVPLMTWAMNNLIPAAINLLSAAIRVLNTIIDAAKPALLWMWENWFAPLAAWVGDLVVRMIKAVTTALEGFSDWANNNQPAMQLIMETVFAFFAGFLFYAGITKVIAAISAAIAFFGTTAALAGMQMMTAKIAFAALGAAIYLIARTWDSLSTGERVLAVIGAAAIAAALAIAIFHTAWTKGLAAIAITAGVLGIVATFMAVKGAMQNLGGPSGVGSMSFGIGNVSGFSASQLSGFQSQASSFQSGLGGNPLPALAQGGLIPPRNPRTVIVGDNKSEDEIVSPRSAIREEAKAAVKEAMQEMRGGIDGIRGRQNSGTRTIILEVDGKQFGRILLPLLDDAKNRQGIRVQTVGVL